MANLPENFEWAKTVQLGTPEVYSLSQASWPRFLLDESDRPDPILKFQMSAKDFAERFRVFGIREKTTQKLVAFMQAVHVEIDLSHSELPDLGWRFSIQNAAQSSTKNALSLVEASIDHKFRGHGLSKYLIARAKEEARAAGFNQVIAPVRPTAKAQFPLETIEKYLTRKTSDGRCFDSWLRTHLDSGAELANVCHNSVCVTATLEWWRERTGLPLSTNGPQVIEGALAPMKVDLAANFGTYIEPNVWVRYRV